VSGIGRKKRTIVVCGQKREKTLAILSWDGQISFMYGWLVNFVYWLWDLFFPCSFSLEIIIIVMIITLGRMGLSSNPE
jgi:hypothetical protein